LRADVARRDRLPAVPRAAGGRRSGFRRGDTGEQVTPQLPARGRRAHRGEHDAASVPRPRL